MPRKPRRTKTVKYAKLKPGERLVVTGAKWIKVPREALVRKERP